MVFYFRNSKKLWFQLNFCNQIHVFLKSSFSYVYINGKFHGYFNCTSRVRQGDPISHLLFRFAKDVLSRIISKFVEDGKLDLIKGTMKFRVPYHSFYSNDFLIYFKGKILGLISVKDFLRNQDLVIVHIINSAKHTIFPCSISHARLSHIVNLLELKFFFFSFNYHGVPIFKRNPKVSYM